MRKNIIYILLLSAIAFLLISCEKEEPCAVTDETCVVTEILQMSRCPDPITGQMTAWKFDTRQDTFHVKTICSKEKLIYSVEEDAVYMDGFKTLTIVCTLK